MSIPREVKDYVADCLAESKAARKLMRERRLKDRKAYKGRRLRHKDVPRRSD